MRRVTGLAVLSRAIAGNGGATLSTTAGIGAAQRRQILTSCSGHTSPLWFTQRLPDRFDQSRSTVARGVPETMRFSVTATTLAQDFDAKEKFQPKDVVLYQFEACPFCNKVKGELDVSCPFLLNRLLISLLIVLTEIDFNFTLLLYRLCPVLFSVGNPCVSKGDESVELFFKFLHWSF